MLAAPPPSSLMLKHWLWGPLSPLGLGLAALTVLADQAHKAWMLYVYDIGAKSPVALTPFFDLVLVWNQGISYGLLPQESVAGRWGLILFAVAAAIALAVWLARVASRLAAASIGLIIGGAVGNAIDRAIHGAVVDFVLFHITTETFRFNWYVFNLADAAIVAGVAGVLYDSLRPGFRSS